MCCLLMACDSAKKIYTQDEMLDVRSEVFVASYIIYLLDDANELTMEDLKRETIQLLPSFNLVDSLGYDSLQSEVSILYTSKPHEDMPAPELSYLAYSADQLTKEEMEKMQKPAAAFFLSLAGPTKEAVPKQLIINKLIAKLSEDKSVAILDLITGESFNSTAWKRKRCDSFKTENVDISSQVTIHLYREETFCRAVSLGMAKFGLPDLSVSEIPCSSQESFVHLINLLGQSLLEKPYINPDFSIDVAIDSLKNETLKASIIAFLDENAKQVARVHLQNVEPQEGDDYNDQFELLFSDDGFSSSQEEQQWLINQLFGNADSINYIKHNEELLSASNRAKEELPRLKKMFNEGLEPGCALLLKAPFRTDDGGNEWMWVEVTKWSQDEIEGVLQNNPFHIVDLKAGSTVFIALDDVFDYTLRKADGTTEGNETGKIIEKMNQ